MDGRLFFHTNQDYENTIQELSLLSDDELLDWEVGLSYQSLRSSFRETDLEEMGFEDNLFTTLLDSNSTVRIGDYVYRVNLMREEVRVSPADNDTDVQIYSIDDDVLEVVEEGLGERIQSCGNNKEKEKNWNVALGTVECKVVYQRGGIFFSLQSKIKRNFFASTQNSPFLEIDQKSGSFRPNRKSTSSINPKYQSGFDRVYSDRPYCGTRRLVSFNYPVEFYCVDGIFGPYSVFFQIICQ